MAKSIAKAIVKKNAVSSFMAGYMAGLVMAGYSKETLQKLAYGSVEFNDIVSALLKAYDKSDAHEDSINEVLDVAVEKKDKGLAYQLPKIEL